MKNQNKTAWGNDDFSLTVGTYLRRGVTVFRIVEDFRTHLKLEHVVTLKSKLIDVQELLSEYRAGTLLPSSERDVERALINDGFTEDDMPATVSSAMSSLSDATKAAGDKLIAYITRLREHGYSCLRPNPMIELDIERIRKSFGDNKAPRASTLYRASLDIEKSGGDLRAAYPKYSDRGGHGNSRLNPAASEAFNESIEKLKKDTKARISYQQVMDDVRSRLTNLVGHEQAILLQPSISTITRETKKSFTDYEICRRNKGQKAADKQFAKWTPRDRAINPLEVVELDDKDSRVFGIDERTGLPAGRLYITAGVDQFSAVPMGFSISDRPRNTWSAINAFANCVLPKDVTQLEFSEVISDVPYMGKMGIAVFDNALYNHSSMFNAAVGDISNAIAAFAKPFTPREKSIIEDFNGRMVKDLFSTLPGFLGPKDSRDFLVEGQTAANMSVSEFRKRLLNWAYNVYCNAPRASGLSPRQMWEVGMVGRKCRLPRDINRVRLASMLRQKVKLRPELISFTGLIYQNHRLELLRRRIGHNAEVEFKYHPEHLEQIFVFDVHQKEWFAVPSANPEYTANLSLYQHVLIRKMAKENGARNPSLSTLFAHRQILKSMVEQSRLSPHLKQRKWANRVQGEQGLTAPNPPPAITLVMTDLEAQIADIEAVEMDGSDDGWEFPAP